MKKVLAAGLILAFSGVASAQNEESYLCISDQNVGFQYNDLQTNWEKMYFKEHKYLIRKPKAHEIADGVLHLGEEPSLVVLRFGESKVGYYCSNEFLAEAVYCKETLAGEFKFDKETLRYLLTHTYGYIGNNSLSTTNTPFIEIGTCTRL